MSLLGVDGSKKYLSETELDAFRAANRVLPPPARAYNLALLYTGARRCEALWMEKRHVDIATGEIILLTLKKRRLAGGAAAPRPPRRVPVPDELIDALDMAFNLRKGKRDERLWNVTPRTANRWTGYALERAGLDGHSIKSLRHTFGVRATMRGVPITTIADLMGHADIQTTAIYATPLGDEKASMVRRMWE